MAKSTELMAGSRAVSGGDLRRIVAECRKALFEEAERLGPSKLMRMLAVQRAMEATLEDPTGFSLKAINDQIRLIAKGAEGLPGAAVDAARRVDLRVTHDHRRSFFTSYISGKTGDGKRRRFNSYVRTACARIGLDYVAVIGGSPSGKYEYYYLKRAREEPLVPESTLHLEQLAALVGEGAALLARRGWGAPEVGQAYRNALEFGEKIPVGDEPAVDRLRFEVGIGLWSHSLVHGDLQEASAVVLRLREKADRTKDQSMRVVALRAAGTTALWLGRFADAQRELGGCLEALGDGSGYRPFASDLGASPFSLVASDLAAALAVLGRHKEAIETIRRAREFLTGADHPFHDCYSLTFSSWIKLELGDLAGAAADASGLIRLAGRFELAALRGLGTALEGIIRAFLADDPKDGIGVVYRGLGEWQASGSALFVSCLLTEAAKVWLKAGDARQAELALEEAFEFARKTGDGFYIAEMHRLRGEIRLTRDQDFRGAESDFHKALEITDAQQSRMFRLRGAVSLLHLARERSDLPRVRQGREVARAQRLLREVCDSFARKPESAELRAARRLIMGTPERRRGAGAE